ncbi:hypothetical protein, partial [Candidatus Anaplasma sp. TIGMIC]|uniref:hypothetical protein n=1 Tax=Candidatus Anaplasma sp. TIGMIC TaxID=3020713 RepID=UPI00232A8D27
MKDDVGNESLQLFSTVCVALFSLGYVCCRSILNEVRSVVYCGTDACFVLFFLCTVSGVRILNAVRSIVYHGTEGSIHGRRQSANSDCGQELLSSADNRQQQDDRDTSISPGVIVPKGDAMRINTPARHRDIIRQEVTIDRKVKVWRLTEDDVRPHHLLYLVLVFWVWFD